jgi:transcriptional regulator with XRE-family HTH domain
MAQKVEDLPRGLRPGEMILILRRRRGMRNLSDLSERSGIPLATLSRIERGGRIKDDVLLRLADALEVSPNDLIGWQGGRELTAQSILESGWPRPMESTEYSAPLPSVLTPIAA